MGSGVRHPIGAHAVRAGGGNVLGVWARAVVAARQTPSQAWRMRQP
jgi:hypothetical protein